LKLSGKPVRVPSLLGGERPGIDIATGNRRRAAVDALPAAVNTLSVQGGRIVQNVYFSALFGIRFT
jgi:hypothetical protein